MISIAYCKNKVAPAGSPWYYSTRYLPKAERHWLWVTQALGAEFSGLLTLRSDPAVAQQKTQWWIEEWLRTCQGEPTHPVTQALRSFPDFAKFDPAPINQVCLALGRYLEPRGFHNEAEFFQFVDEVVLPFYELSAQSQNSQVLQPFVRTIKMVSVVANLRRDILANRVYLPQALLQTSGVTLADLGRLTMTDACGNALKDWGNLARQQFDQGIQGLTPEDRAALNWLVTRAQLALTLFQELEEAQFPVFKEETRLNPLRQLWIARRCWKASKVAGAATN